MTTLVVVLAVSLALSFVMTPIVRSCAARFGIVDHPDERRKMHEQPIPVAGGVAVFAATTIAVLASLLPQSPLREAVLEHGRVLVGLLAASLVIVVVGIADDVLSLRGRHKLVGQIIAAAIVVASGLVVHHLSIFGWDVDLGVMAIPFTMFWILGAINALNLIDGMDGLSSCVGLIISLAIAAMAVLGGSWATAVIAVGLAGALLGFLRFNFPPASIFLGDSGSMLIGLVVGVLAIHSSLKGPATAALAAPIAILTIPIFDTAAAILRRRLTGRSIYTTDRGHLHHCLARAGLSLRGVLFWVSILCLATGLGALASLALQNEMFAILTTLTVIGILIMSRLFGYAEFLLIKDRLIATSLSFLHRSNGNGAHEATIRLQGSADWKELWGRMVEIAQRMDLKSLRLDVNAPAIHESYHARWDRPEEPEAEASRWRAVVPLTAQGQTVGRIEVVGERNHVPVWDTIAALARPFNDFEAAVADLTAASKAAMKRNVIPTQASLPPGELGFGSAVN